MPATKPPNMLEVAKRLYALGLDLIWLRPQSKKPVQNNWTTIRRQSLNDLKRSYRIGNNLGIRCGALSKVDDTHCLIVVDVDISAAEERFSLEAFAAAEELLGDPSMYPTVMSGRGNGSRHLYVAVEIERLPHSCTWKKSDEKVTVLVEGKPKLKPAWQIDILAVGRQVLAPGCVHPDSGGIYTELVPVEAPIPAALESFYEILESIPAHQVQRATVTPIGEAADISLDALPISEYTKGIIRDGDIEGRWPSRSEMIQAVLVVLLSAGIDEQTVCAVMTCPAYAIAEKALEERKGVRASAMEWIARQIPKTRAYLEKSRTERLEVDLSEPRRDPELAALAEKHNRMRRLEVITPAPQTIDPFPVETLNEVVGILQAEAPEVCYQTGQVAALTLASAAAARRYRTEFGDPLNLYVGLVTHSIGMVRHYKPALYRTLAEAGFKSMIANGRFTSPANLYATLYRSPALLYVADDYGIQLQFAKRQPSGLLEQALSIFADIHAAKPIFLNNGQDAGLGKRNEQVVIHHPAMAMLAMISTDQLATIMRASELGRGALEQFLFVMAPEDPAAYTLNTPDPTPLPVWLIEHIKLIRYEERTDDSNLVKDDAEHEPDLKTVRFDAQLEPAYESIMNITTHREARPILLSARGILRRLAAVVAVWHNPARPVVDRDILGWAAQYLIARLREFLDRFNILSTEEGKLTPYQQTLDYILAGGPEGRTPKMLSQKCWAYKKLSRDKRDEVIDLLLEDEEIVIIHKGRGKAYIASKFTREVEGREQVEKSSLPAEATQGAAYSHR